METPDITAVQIKAVVLWFVQLLGLFGVAVSDQVSTAVISLLAGFSLALPVILVYADSVIRKARAENLSAIVQAKVQLAPLPEPSGFGGE